MKTQNDRGFQSKVLWESVLKDNGDVKKRSIALIGLLCSEEQLSYI